MSATAPLNAVPGVKTIFWDLGGVILSNGWDHTQRSSVLGPLGVDLQAYEAAHERENFFWERGLMSAREFFDRTVLGPNPQLGFTYEQLWPMVCGQSSVLHEECFDILDELTATGRYRMATLNNESRELNAYRMDVFGLRHYFSYLICSGYVHEMKPAAGIYQAAIDISGLPAESSLFIDDKQENCDAAVTLGMQAIRFESPAALRSDLQRIGITV